MIRLIGPGAAGKTTVGHALARRLGFPFIDLDERFRIRFGDISVYLDSHEYSCYAKRNVQLYLDSLDGAPRCAVFALSSGFMTYNDPHPAYERVYRDILASSSTLVLLPSFDYEICVAETVRRHLERPFSRSAKREEEVIRTRFKVYWSMPVKKCATNRPFDVVVQDLLAQLLPVIEDRQLAPYLNKPDCWHNGRGRKPQQRHCLRSHPKLPCYCELRRVGAHPVRGKGRAHPYKNSPKAHEPSFSLISADSRQ